MKSTKLWEARGSMICYLESKSKFPHRLNISLWSLHDLKHAKPHGAWVRILLKIKLLTSLICGVQQSRGSWSSNRPSIHSGCHSRPSFPRAQPLDPLARVRQVAGSQHAFWNATATCPVAWKVLQKRPALARYGQVIPASLDFKP